MDIHSLDTPALLIERSILEKNVSDMQKLANSAGVNLRPHIKTHKIPELALFQVQNGACGIASAKISEAEVMADYGFADIQIPNIIIGELKLSRLLGLSQKVERLSCSVDSMIAASGLSRVFTSMDKKLNVFVEIDSGLGRCGLKDFDDILALCRYILDSKGLLLSGLLTHAGHAYKAENLTEIKRIGTEEGNSMVALAAKLREKNIPIEEISVGSTPTAPYCSQVKGITEIRPGNYVYHDAIQMSLGVATQEQCALNVLATVISVHRDGRVVIDAGSKALSSDMGAHGSDKINGYGVIIDKNAVLERLSEEHGIIKNIDAKFEIGEKIRIIPNHACVVSNLHEFAYLVDGADVIDTFKVAARGKMA